MNILEYYVDGIERYSNKGILMDSGPLLLLIVGLHNRDQIERYPRTRSHTVKHFDLLKNILSGFRIVVTTPNILTEVSDLLGKFPSLERENVLSKHFGPCIASMCEKYFASSELCKSTCFRTLGLADASIADCAKGNYLVLTEDLDLWAYLKKNDIEAVNFNHLCF